MYTYRRKFTVTSRDTSSIRLSGGGSGTKWEKKNRCEHASTSGCLGWCCKSFLVTVSWQGIKNKTVSRPFHLVPGPLGRAQWALQPILWLEIKGHDIFITKVLQITMHCKDYELKLYQDTWIMESR